MILSLGYSGEYCNKRVCGSLSSTLILFSPERSTYPKVELLGGVAVLFPVLDSPPQTVSITAALTEALSAAPPCILTEVVTAFPGWCLMTSLTCSSLLVSGTRYCFHLKNVFLTDFSKLEL